MYVLTQSFYTVPVVILFSAHLFSTGPLTDHLHLYGMAILPHWISRIVRLRSTTMCEWPLLVYANQQYDPEEPWEGLFRTHLLVWVCSDSFIIFVLFTPLPAGIQTHLHLTQFHGERGESNQIQQCLYTLDDVSHYRLLSLCSHISMSGFKVLSTHH